MYVRVCIYVYIYLYIFIYFKGTSLRYTQFVNHSFVYLYIYLGFTLEVVRRQILHYEAQPTPYSGLTQMGVSENRGP